MTTVLTAVVKYGMAGIAAYLLYVITTGILVDVHQNSADIRQTNILLQQHIESSGRMERQQAIITDILRQNCVNNSKNPAQVQSCWNAGYR